MSTERKVTKVVSLILLAFAVVSGIMAVTQGLALLGSVASEPVGATVFLGIVTATVSLGAGLSGIRGANTPSKARPLLTWCMVGIAFQALALVFTAMDLATSSYAWISAAAALFVVAYVAGRRVWEKSQK